MGKEEIAPNEQFLRFPQCFLLNQKIVAQFVNIFDIISLFAAELEEPKIGMWGKGLKSNNGQAGDRNSDLLLAHWAQSAPGELLWSPNVRRLACDVRRPQFL